MPYKIVRVFRGDHRDPSRPWRTRVIVRGLTLDEARAWCSDPETSSSTATSAAARRRTKKYGPWFDGFEIDK